jgi:SAM-dependent methyltransferase
LTVEVGNVEEATPWHEQDSFWEGTAPFLFGEDRWADAAGQVEDAISLLEISAGARVLDLCCGLGRHSLEFARRGFLVTGVDRTAAYLARAREQAGKEGLDVEFVEDDMRTFRRSESFDAVVSFFTSFGYFENAEDDRQVVTNVHGSLCSGGAFLLDVIGKEVLARVFQERTWGQEGDTIVLQEHRVSEDWGRTISRWIVIRNGEKNEFDISLRLYSATELVALLKRCGFDQVEVYGDLKGAPYDHRARRLVAVGRKYR